MNLITLFANIVVFNLTVVDVEYSYLLRLNRGWRKDDLVKEKEIIFLKKKKLRTFL